MYCSITLAKTKKPRWFRKKSPALKNPKIIRGELFEWREGNFDGSGTQKIHSRIKDPYLAGEEIIRLEPKPSYIIKIGESYRQDGKVKTRQKHIRTFDEWEVIDNFLEYQGSGNKQGAGFFIDGYDFDNDMKKGFPDADLDLAWTLVQDKIEPIETRIVEEFKQTDEYRWWVKTNKLRKKLRAETAKAKAKEKKKQEAYERKSRQHNYESFNNSFPGIGSPTALSLSPEEARVIDTCYKAMAVQLHPDKGGSAEDMAILNNLKDRIRKGL